MLARRARTVVLIAAALAEASCQVATDFTLVPVEETTEELCSDGKDTNFDGLTDCQDWGCLDKLVCCDIPEVLLEDHFDSGPADCDVPECEVPTSTCAAEAECGPDPDVWHFWPCPYPRVCGGAFHIDKTTCFAAGALSRATVGLEPGLLVQAEVSGQPERRGYLEVALTLQDELMLPGSLDPCGRDQRVEGFAALRLVWSENGYRVSAALQQVEIGVSDEITDPDALHAVSLGVDNDRHLFYSVDGVEFARSDVPVPATDELARVALSGLTEQIAIDSVRVQAGLRCHDPRAWAPAGDTIEESVALSPTGELAFVFDRDEVFNPSVRFGDGSAELFYTGCQLQPDSSLCEPYEPLGIGRASSTNSVAFVRDSDKPVLVPSDIAEVGLAGIHRNISVQVLPATGLRGFVAPGSDVGIIPLDDTLALDEEVVQPGIPGVWDEQDICCVTALEHPDGKTYLWYAAREALDDPTARIGLAVSEDGTIFERSPDNPVLEPGPPGSFDSESVTNPTVVYDAERNLFRMWYDGRDFFGKTSIGYAISTDGAHWHKWPGNPVLVPEDVGMTSIGAPDVHLASDGRLRAWVHGTTTEDVHREIFELRNEGALVGR